MRKPFIKLAVFLGALLLFAILHNTCQKLSYDDAYEHQAEQAAFQQPRTHIGSYHFKLPGILEWSAKQGNKEIGFSLDLTSGTITIDGKDQPLADYWWEHLFEVVNRLHIDLYNLSAPAFEAEDKPEEQPVSISLPDAANVGLED